MNGITNSHHNHVEWHNGSKNYNNKKTPDNKSVPAHRRLLECEEHLNIYTNQTQESLL